MSKVKADIRMITTSEVDISLLVVKADADMTVDAIRENFLHRDFSRKRQAANVACRFYLGIVTKQ